MNKSCLFGEDEKPLDNILTNGGLTCIFRKICVIGDSLSSGEFELVGDDGNHTYHDMYEYSWGQYIARMCGCEVSNFSRGGMSAKWYIDSFADEWGLWDERKAAQAYIIALGANDVNGDNFKAYGSIGTADDIDFEDYTKNKRTFAGYYGEIIQRYKKIQPNAKFFLVTMPQDTNDSDETKARKDEHRKLLLSLAEVFSNAYVIDLRKYDCVHDKEYKKSYYLNGHLTPAGYYMSARVISSYIDYIIRHDMDEFKHIGFMPHN